MLATVLMSAGLATMQVACDRPGAVGHMMGGGMMGQMAPGNIDRLPEAPQSNESQLLRRYCGECHVPPAPAAHTAREWPQVVARMKQHMVIQGEAVPDPEQLREIIDYLRQHAG
jgi:hypothetical protein